MWNIVRYEAGREREWNEFVSGSRNGTFLFDRSYMDYHSDRFSDASLMAFKDRRLMALLPANLTPDGTVHSHSGLTYGGWILPSRHLDGADMLEIFGAAIDHWKSEGISRLDYKTIPYIYASQPSAEDEYALFRLGARLTSCGLSSTIDLRNPGPFNQLQRRHLAKASQLPIEVIESRDICGFMSMLADCLHERHDTMPVHSADEMKLLASRFPENIKFYVVLLDGRMHAGTCVYDTGRVAHTQYIATTSEGRRLNLLTPLLHKLITDIFAKRAYFDFGISTEDDGRVLNSGLLRQKTSYGAGAAVYKRFSLEF